MNLSMNSIMSAVRYASDDALQNEEPFSGVLGILKGMVCGVKTGTVACFRCELYGAAYH